MVLVLLGFHLAGVGMVLALGRRLGIRPLLALGGTAPAISAVWAVVQLIAGSSDRTSMVTWVGGLDLELRFKVDSLALLMTLLVSGIGALVFIYAIGYFNSDTTGGSRFSASLLGFSASMVGLVWADSVWTLFIFWELTSVTSFLLVGHKNQDPSVLAAARRALMITGAGGLILLAGLLVLAQQANTTIISELPAIGGTSGTIAAILVLVGAATKSAQVPFHVWLPGAMAAPTPVSAYLHSATMVKAGVLLLAVTGPAFANVEAFTTLGLAFGLTSMLWGAVGALRQGDAKLILAWGTISQLGLMVTLLALGTGKAVFAAISLLFAHALFKAALFLIVGEVDVRTGTRQIDQLGGLASSMPLSFAAAAVAGLSMAGAPPLLGFTAKEAALESLATLDGVQQIVVSVGVGAGSVLTVAYTLRFVFGVFGPGPPTVVAPRRWLMTIPALTLASLGFVGYLVLGWVNDIVRPAAVELNAAADYSLLRWPGLTAPFGASLGILAVGTALGFGVIRRNVGTPEPKGARTADALLDGVLVAASRATGRIQHGSLPVYLTVMAATASLAALPFFTGLDTSGLVLANQPLEMVLAAAILVSATAGAFVGSRLGAALTLGAVGTGVSGLFVLYGAPDLALTQLLVETIVVVGFVIGLGHLAQQFPAASGGWRLTRLAVSVLGGLSVTAALAAAAANSVGQAPLADLKAGAVDEGGGNNIVNVILTDMRALDTLGEVVVLATVALGILALANVRPPEVPG